MTNTNTTDTTSASSSPSASSNPTLTSCSAPTACGCPCGSVEHYDACCGLRHRHGDAATPEQLMRSRYCAFTQGNVDYLYKTMRGPALTGFDKTQTQTWANGVYWLGLSVINTTSHPTDPTIGYVEFIARYLEHGFIKLIHEVSEFHLVDGVWYYVQGEHIESTDLSPKVAVSRNAPCPCLSGKKFKNCHAK